MPTIRHSEARDIEAIRQIYAQPSVYASTLQLPWPSAELWMQRLGTRQEHFHSLVACEEDEVRGQVGIEVFANPRRRHSSAASRSLAKRGRSAG